MTHDYEYYEYLYGLVKVQLANRLVQKHRLEDTKRWLENKLAEQVAQPLAEPVRQYPRWMFWK